MKDSTILELNIINEITSDLSFPVSSNDTGEEITGQINIASIYNFIKTQMCNELGLESDDKFEPISETEITAIFSDSPN